MVEIVWFFVLYLGKITIPKPNLDKRKEIRNIVASYSIVINKPLVE